MPKAAESFLFDLFTEAATKTFADCVDVFVCPLCLQAFGSLSDLNRAHLWPEALGGRIFTLACRKCNTEVGSAIESHEIKRVKYFSQERVPFRQQINGIEGDIGGFLSIRYENEEPTLILEISDRHSNPKALSDQSDAFETGEVIKAQSTLTLPTGYNREIAPLTYLHFAYMTLFHLGGYSWTSTAIAEHIRQQLKHPKEATFPVCLVPFTNSETGGLAETIEPILFEVVTPEELDGYLVATPELEYEGNQRKAIWIPRVFDGYEVHRFEDIQNTKLSCRFLTSVGKEAGQGKFVEQKWIDNPVNVKK